MILPYKIQLDRDDAFGSAFHYAPDSDQLDLRRGKFSYAPRPQRVLWELRPNRESEYSENVQAGAFHQIKHDGDKNVSAQLPVLLKKNNDIAADPDPSHYHTHTHTHTHTYTCINCRCLYVRETLRHGAAAKMFLPTILGFHRRADLTAESQSATAFQT